MSGVATPTVTRRAGEAALGSASTTHLSHRPNPSLLQEHRVHKVETRQKENDETEEELIVSNLRPFLLKVSRQASFAPSIPSSPSRSQSILSLVSLPRSLPILSLSSPYPVSILPLSCPGVSSRTI